MYMRILFAHFCRLCLYCRKVKFIIKTFVWSLVFIVVSFYIQILFLCLVFFTRSVNERECEEDRSYCRWCDGATYQFFLYHLQILNVVPNNY
jgi:hypothetical protein